MSSSAEADRETFFGIRNLDGFAGGEMSIPVQITWKVLGVQGPFVLKVGKNSKPISRQKALGFHAFPALPQ